MPLVPVKCTSCGGDIQLDDTRETGFCIYCGSKVVFRDAIQKMELSVNVTVNGTASLENLLEYAELYRKLDKDFEKIRILSQAQAMYPGDYRAYWICWKDNADLYLSDLDKRTNNILNKGYVINPSSYADYSRNYILASQISGDILSVMHLAPKSMLHEIRDIVNNFYEKIYKFNLVVKDYEMNALTIWTEMHEAFKEVRVKIFSKQKQWENFLLDLQNRYNIRELNEFDKFEYICNHIYLFDRIIDSVDYELKKISENIEIINRKAG